MPSKRFIVFFYKQEIFSKNWTRSWHRHIKIGNVTKIQNPNHIIIIIIIFLYRKDKLHPTWIDLCTSYTQFICPLTLIFFLSNLPLFSWSILISRFMFLGCFYSWVQQCSTNKQYFQIRVKYIIYLGVCMKLGRRPLIHIGLGMNSV